MYNEKIAITKNDIKFIPCASFWSKPKNMERMGIKIVPPPMPKPPKIPDKKPAVIYKK